jgi:glycosyltransferase involved in cell wall biosynthesis
VAISVIIPTYNRCTLLQRTLQSVAHLDASPNTFEVIVVDNGSTDATLESFEFVRSRFRKIDFRYFREPIPGLLSGRHRGVREARGDICAFLDDDVRLNPDWLRALEEGFQDPAIILAGGPSRPLFECSPPNWLSNFYDENEQGRFCIWLSLFDGGNRRKRVDPCYVFGLNFAIRKKALFEFGGFNPDLITKSLQRFQGDGDYGLTLKLRRANLKAFYHPDASLLHDLPAKRLTAKYFEQRSFRQGVCDSYTVLRSNGKRLQSPWSRFVSYAKQLISPPSARRNLRVNDIRIRTQMAYRAGYHFHRSEVLRDPVLLAWVRKKDYWDYSLPQGWPRYLSPVVQ